MATQGVVSIVRNELSEVAFKIVAGCDGYNAEELAKAILKKSFDDLTCELLLEMAKEAGFGCEDDLVVLGRGCKPASEMDEGDLGPLYHLTFDNPWFNPRWGRGSADYRLCVSMETRKVYEFIDPRYM